MFQIGLHDKDKALLEQIKTYFDLGSITKQGLNSTQYRVNTVKDLSIIINHFDKYPLITQKLADYLLFKQAFMLIQNKEHLTMEGLRKIISIKVAINKGLSDKLKLYFLPQVSSCEFIPTERPLVLDKKITNPRSAPPAAGVPPASGGN